jgi:hypothetical protein
MRKTMIERLRGAVGTAPADVRDKGLAGAFSLLVVGAVLWPVAQNWRETARDSFPLSYYPMFSAKRRKNVSVNYLVGLDERGGRHLLPYTYAGRGGLNQARRQINRLVREGKADDLCRTVSSRVARKKKGPYAGVTTVQVVTGRYRLADYFSGKKEALSERVLASRPVERRPA